MTVSSPFTFLFYLLFVFSFYLQPIQTYMTGNYSVKFSKDVFLPINTTLRILSRLNYFVFQFSFLPPSSFYVISQDEILQYANEWVFSLANITVPNAHINQSRFSFDVLNHLLLVTMDNFSHFQTVIFERRTNMNIPRPLCTTSNIFKGKWTISANLVAPHYKEMIDKQCPHFHIELNKYAYSTPFKLSFFETNDDCKVIPSEKSLEIYRKEFGSTEPKVIAVGDSLVQQTIFAADCDSESFHFGKITSRNHFHRSNYLRHDIPCDFKNCSDPSFVEFWNQPERQQHSPCLGCAIAHTVKSSYRNDSLNHKIFPWVYDGSIPNQTDILILDVGAWISRGHSLSNYSETFKETLELLAPKIIYLQKTHPNMTIFWQGQRLTPVIPVDHELQTVPNRNLLAQAILGPLGVIYLDLYSFSKERVLKDPKCMPDNYHFMNPGPFAVPSFLWERIMHLFIVEGRRRDKLAV